MCPSSWRSLTAAHRAGLPVVAHAHSFVGMQNALAVGVDGIEHFTGLSSAGGAQIDDDLLLRTQNGPGVYACPFLAGSWPLTDGIGGRTVH